MFHVKHEDLLAYCPHCLAFYKTISKDLSYSNTLAALRREHAKHEDNPPPAPAA
jgi:hypothetical protein